MLRLAWLSVAVVWVSACAEPEEPAAPLDPFAGGATVVLPSQPTVVDTMTVRVPGVVDGLVAAADLDVTWFVDGALAASTWELPAGVPRGAVVAAVVRYGDLAEFTADVVVANSRPSVPQLSFLPTSPRIGDSLEVLALTDDADGDELLYEYDWSVNGLPVAAVEDALPSGSYVRGDAVRVRVRVDDGHGGVSEANVETVVADTPPVAPTVDLHPTAPRAGEQNLVCRLVTPATDVDGDVLTYRFQWKMDGVPWAGATYRTLLPGDTISGAEIEGGQRWTCAVVAEDGELEAASVQSDGVDVRARSPVGYARAPYGSCTLFDDDSVTCTGLAADGRLLDGTEEPWVAVEMSENWLCGITRASAIECRGAQYYYWNLEQGEPSSRMIDLAVGQSVGVGLRDDGELVSWGSTNYSPPEGTFESVKGFDGDRFCAIATSGAATCWGSSIHTSARPDAETAFRDVIVGSDYGCGVLADGTLSCWGEPLLTPPGGSDFVEIVGMQPVCARTDAGAVSCWNLDGPVPTPTDTFVDLLSHNGNACGVTDTGGLRCWGASEWTREPPWLGTALTNQAYRGCVDTTDAGWTCTSTSLAAELPLVDAVTVGEGDEFACMLDAAGALTCVVDSVEAFAVLPPASGTYVSLAVGDDYGCVLDATGVPTCWYASNRGFTAPPAGLRFQKITVGTFPVCGIDVDGHPHCWVRLSGSTPTSETLVDLAVGESACGLRVDGSMVCWGDNVVAPAGVFRQVAVSGTDWCGILENEQLACWGYSGGAGGLSRWPRGGRWRQLVGEADGTMCALELDGHTECWGRRTR